MRLKSWIIIIIVLGTVSVIAAIRYWDFGRSNDKNGAVIVVPEVSINQKSINKSVVSDQDVVSIEAVSQLPLDKAFMLEARNVTMASQIERQISQKFGKSRQFKDIEVFCQSTICRIRGVMEVTDKTQVEGLLKEIRDIANFNETAASPAKAIDNTVYNIDDIDPLRIRFTTFARW